MNDEALVQPIFIDPTFPLDAILRNVMCASAKAVLEDTPVIEKWLADDYRKTVRSAKPSMLTRLKMEETGWQEHGIALAFNPCRYDEFSKLMRRGQVSGWEHKVLPMDVPAPYNAPSGILYAPKRLSMSTGKLAAQAAHAAVFMARDHGLESLFRINFVYSDDLPETGYAIRDNGHTEVESGTHTVTLIPNCRN